jgi:hypothetical protein
MGFNLGVFQYIGFGLAIANGICAALADGKLTADEIIGFINTIITNFSPKLKIQPGEIIFDQSLDGNVSITLASSLLERTKIDIC